MQLYKYASIKEWKYGSLKYGSWQVCKRTSIKVFDFGGMQVCKYATKMKVKLEALISS